MKVREASREFEGLQLAPIQRWPTPRSKVWTANFLDSARNDGNIVAVIAVGSAIRPAVSSVDLDLVVICRDPAELKYKPPIEIDMRAYAVEQVDRLIDSGNDLLGWAVKYGSALFQRDNYWDSIVTSWRHRLPLPSAEVAARRANDALHRLNSMRRLGDDGAAYEQALSYLTHLARVELLKRGRYPASRPELPEELRAIGCAPLADRLERLINRTAVNPKQLAQLLQSAPSNTGQESIVTKRSNHRKTRTERRPRPARGPKTSDDC